MMSLMGPGWANSGVLLSADAIIRAFYGFPTQVSSKALPSIASIQRCWQCLGCLLDSSCEL